MIKLKLNKLIDKHACVIIEQKNGKVYHVKSHWRYLDWKRDAERVEIGEGKISDNQFEYLTHKFSSTFKRTKF